MEMRLRDNLISRVVKFGEKDENLKCCDRPIPSFYQKRVEIKKQSYEVYRYDTCGGEVYVKLEEKR